MPSRKLYAFGWITSVTLLVAQGAIAQFSVLTDLQSTGNASAWAWGTNTFARRIEERKFSLWRVHDSNIQAVTLPSELSAVREDLEPGASFLDEKNGFVVWTQNRISEGDGVRFTLVTAETLDSGNSWRVQQQTIDTEWTFLGVNQVQFTDHQNGHLIVGTGGAAGTCPKTLLHTTDGGRHWEVDPASQTVVGGENAPIHMLFRSQSEGWISTAGVHGQPSPNISLCHTTDGGKTWHCSNKFAGLRACSPDCYIEDITPVYVNPADSREAFFLVSPSDAREGGDPAKNFATRYRTHDGGVSWSAPENVAVPGANWVFADFDFGVAQKDARMFLTNDGGRTWSYNAALSEMLAPFKSSVQQKKLYRKDHSLWLIAGMANDSHLLYSSNDGLTWQALAHIKL